MIPGELAMRHPAGPMLHQWATTGCPVDIEHDWNLQQLDDAVAYGAHPSAKDPVAATALRLETMAKVDRGFAKVIRWSVLRRLLLKGENSNTKISPCAAIPHKSRKFRLLLDLSDKGQGRDKSKEATPAVNDLTNQEAAPRDSMNELGSSIPRMIQAMATWPEEEGALLMAKWDIQDGFWRMAVEEAEEHQFCYVLPADPLLPMDDDPMIVVPKALQMGWTSSPAFFCAATETARDLAQYLLSLDALPAHSMEDHTLLPIPPDVKHDMIQLSQEVSRPSKRSKKINYRPLSQDNLDEICFETFQNLPQPPPTSSPLHAEYLHSFKSLLEIFVDDFVGIVQTKDMNVLRHTTRAMLHAIHQIFPPQEKDDPISHKKLVIDGEGIWDTRKEILGWIFDGRERTMELPRAKLEFLADELSVAATRTKKGFEFKRFQSLVGKCQHAAFGIPGGSALITPLYSCMKAAERGKNKHVQIHPGTPQAEALADLKTNFKVMGRKPVRCIQLVPGDPHYIGFCDACKYGAGGVWLSGTNMLKPIVWRMKWPKEVVDRFGPQGITINDLEMAGMLLAHMILAQVVDVKECRTACWCDNTSTVSWTAKFSSKKSTVGQQLTRALALFMISQEASPITPLSIPGVDNKMADLPSRSFHKGGPGNFDLDDSEFLTMFNSDFPLTQNASWLMLGLKTKLSSLVCTLLLSKPVPAGSWLRPTKSGCVIGRTGSPTASGTTWTPFSKEQMLQLNSGCSSPMPSSYETGMLVEETLFASARSKQRLATSARYSVWNTPLG